MPTYDYVCKACGHRFELFQSMTAPVKRKCPSCGELKLERLVGTGAGIIFKGGGFYETDYRGDSYRKAAEAEKKSAEGATEAGKKKDSGADAKPAPEAKPASASGDSPAPPKSDGAAKRPGKRKAAASRRRG